MQEGPAVFIRRGRIHDDETVVRRLNTKVTSKAGVTGGGLQGLKIKPDFSWKAVQPVEQGSESSVCVWVQSEISLYNTCRSALPLPRLCQNIVYLSRNS